jgi:hypothetical protein
MRLLEQHNPDVEFDWSRILKDAPPDQGRRDPRDRERDPRDRDRRDRRDSRPAPRPRPLETTAVAVPPAPPPARHEREADAAEIRAAAHADLVLSAPEPEPEPEELPEPEPESVALEHGEPLAADHAEYVEYAEAFASVTRHRAGTEPEMATEPPIVTELPIVTEPAVVPGFEGPPPAAAARLGADGLARLRQRYTQLVARLAEKPMEDAARAELNAEVERLNPDAWLTADEVAAALEQYESVFDRLRAVVGHYPPRRRRR